MVKQSQLPRCELENEILTAGQIQEGLSLLPTNELQPVIPGYSSTELLLRVLIIPSFLHFPGLDMDFLLLCEARLNPCYFSLHSDTEALSWRTNQLQLCNDPNHWCAETSTQESKALTLAETIREEKITAHSPCPELHTYCGSSTGTPS